MAEPEEGVMEGNTERMLGCCTNRWFAGAAALRWPQQASSGALA